MEKVLIYGLMVGDIREIMFLIKNMDMVYTTGMMGENLKVTGKMEKDKEKVNIFYQVEFIDMEYGKMIKESNG